MSKPERIEENKFVRAVRRKGYIAYKMQTKGAYGSNGFNDQLVLAKYGTTVLFEFKRTDTESEPLQDYRHRQLKKLGHKTYEVDSAAEALSLLEKEIEMAKVRTERLSRRMHRARS